MRLPEPEGAPGPGPADGAPPELAAEVRKLAAAVQWSGQGGGEAQGGWMSWAPWVACVLALAVAFSALQGRPAAPPSRLAELVVDVGPGGAVKQLPLVEVGRGEVPQYALADESSGLELRTADGAVVGRFQGVSEILRRAIAEDQKRAAEREVETAAVRGYLRWALIVAGGVAALALAAGAAWWFFLRRR
jgi:hypothetical protein